jgi:hypothetical protein
MATIPLNCWVYCVVFVGDVFVPWLARLPYHSPTNTIAPLYLVPSRISAFFDRPTELSREGLSFGPLSSLAAFWGAEVTK